MVPALPSLPPTSVDASVPPVPVGSGYTPAPVDISPAPTTPPATGGNTVTTPATKTIAKVDGGRGGLLAGVSAGGLLLLLATAEADRRKMRRAQREIPLEA